MRKVPAKSRAALAAALAIAVHVALLLFLVFGVSWQNRHPEPMTVDLVPPLAATKPEPPPNGWLQSSTGQGSRRRLSPPPCR